MCRPPQSYRNSSGKKSNILGVFGALGCVAAVAKHVLRRTDNINTVSGPKLIRIFFGLCVFGDFWQYLNDKFADNLLKIIIFVQVWSACASVHRFCVGGVCVTAMHAWSIQTHTHTHTHNADTHAHTKTHVHADTHAYRKKIE